MSVKNNLDKYKNIFERQGNYQKAVLIYSKEIEKNPKIEELYYRICFCAFELYNKDTFIFWYNSYIKHIVPTKIIHNFLLIYLKFFEGDLIEIQNILSEIEYNTFYPEEFYGVLLGYYLYTGDFEKGIKVGNEMMSIYPNNWMFAYYTANHYYSIGEYEKSYAVVLYISEEKYSYILDMKLKLLVKLGNKYRHEYINLIKILEKYVSNMYEYSSIGNCYYTIKNYSRAILYYKKSIEYFPYDNYAYNGMANCYIALGQPIIARKLYLQGLNNLIGISYKYAILGIAKTYIIEKEYDTAYKILKNNVYKCGNTPSYLYEISKCMYFKNICNNDTKEYLEKAIVMNPNHGAAKRLLKKVIKKLNDSI